MNSVEQLYNKPDRKRELLLQLEKNFDSLKSATSTLEAKAWQILSVASATFGIISALEITLSRDNVGAGFWIALAFVLGLYLWMVIEVLEAVRPREWRFIPGSDTGQISYEDLLFKYVPVDENEYLDKLIVDYVGKDDSENDGKKLMGAIQATELENRRKAMHIDRAAKLLAAVIIGLIVMAVLSQVS